MIDRTVKLSQMVGREVERAGGDRFVVATVLTVTFDDVVNYIEVGLHLANGSIATRKPAPPPSSCGLYAGRNESLFARDNCPLLCR